MANSQPMAEGAPVYSVMLAKNCRRYAVCVSVDDRGSRTVKRDPAPGWETMATA